MHKENAVACFCASIILLFLSISTANSTPITYNFQLDSSSPSTSILHTSLFYEQSGLGLDILSEADDNGITAPNYIIQDQYGLGIELDGRSDGSEIDHSGPDETLIFQFSEPVKLLELVVSQVGRNDGIEILTNTGPQYSDMLVGGNSTDDAYVDINFNHLDLLGTIFSFKPFGTYAEYSLAEITMDTVAVPEPPILALFGMGMACFCTRCKKRRKYT